MDGLTRLWMEGRRWSGLVSEPVEWPATATCSPELRRRAGGGIPPLLMVNEGKGSCPRVVQRPRGCQREGERERAVAVAGIQRGLAPVPRGLSGEFSGRKTKTNINFVFIILIIVIVNK